MKPKLFISFLCGCLVVFVLGLTDYVNNKTMDSLTITGSITNTSITSAFLSTDASGRHIGKLVQSGLTTLLLTDTSKAITFSTPMGGTNYSVAFTPSIAISSSFGVTNKTVNGFTILSVGVTVGVEWEARER